MRRVFIAVCSCTLVSLSLLAVADSNQDKDVISYREDVMKTLDEQSAALGQIASGVIPNDNLNAHMEAMSLSASMALKAFESKVPGGEAKPNVWSDWAAFSKKMTEFAQKAADGAKAAKAQGSDAAMEAVVDLANRCKDCHDTYRQEKKEGGGAQ